MKPVLLDPYYRSAVLPGTMKSEIEFINQWVMDANSTQNVLWIHGPPGSGKSALTAAVENFYLEMNRLGALIFFDHTKPHESRPRNFICGLAYQLGRFDCRLGDVMIQAIDDRPSVLGQAAYQEMFTKLLSEPLRAVKDMPVKGPSVIVIDAMDQCGEVPWERRELMKVLVAELATLSPTTFRWIIASRSENDLRNHLTKPNILSHALTPESEETRQDIEAMLRHKLTEVIDENPYLDLPADWPGQARVEALVNYADGNFGRAQEALKRIDGYDPEVNICDFLGKHCLQVETLQAGPDRKSVV